VLLPSKDETTYPEIIELSDGGSADDRIELYIHPTGDVAYMWTSTGGVEQVNGGGSTDIVNNTIHSLRMAWKQNTARVYVDDTSEILDTSCIFPDDLDRIDVGMAIATTYQLDGIISNLKIYKKVVK
jgi:hypothetical protein